MRPLLLLTATATLAATPALAEALDDAAIHAEPQYYLMSLPAAPVAEIAEAVLGEALGLPFKVDDDVKAEMRFQIDGMYAPKALAREFGYRLWNADVALIERPSDGLWLIPRGELDVALTQGATLISPPVGVEPRRAAPPAPRQAAVTRTPPQAGPAGPDMPWPLWLLLGWGGGLATMLGWNALRRSRRVAPAVLLPSPTPLAESDPDDLVIPVFMAR